MSNISFRSAEEETASRGPSLLSSPSNRLKWGREVGDNQALKLALLCYFEEKPLISVHGLEDLMLKLWWQRIVAGFPAGF